MVYPLITFIKYIFGDRISATKLLSNITPKRMIGYHVINLFISIFLTFFISSLLVDLIKNDQIYPIISQFTNISTLTILNAFIPIIVLSYVLIVLFLLLISILYQILATAFRSTIDLRTTIYSLQFLSILHPLVYLFLLSLLFFSEIGLISISIVLFYLFAVMFFFSFSKQYAQIARLTTITMILVNALILGLISLVIYLVVGGISKI